MHKLQRISISATTILMSLSFTAAIPVYAQGGSGSGSHDATEVSTTQDDTTTGTTETEHAGTTEAVHSGGGTEQQRLKRQEDQAAKKAEKAEAKKEKTSAAKQKKCEAHKQGLTNKFSHIATNSDRIKTRIDDILTKAQAYQTTNNLTVDSTLLSKATDAQQAAADAIANMKTVQPTIDCNSTSVASDVANFKVAATKTRDALKDYRTAVKNYLHALKDAKKATTTTGASND